MKGGRDRVMGGGAATTDKFAESTEVDGRVTAINGAKLTRRLVGAA